MQIEHRAMLLLLAMVLLVSLGYGAGLPLVRPYLLRNLGAVPGARIAWHVGMLGGIYLFGLFVFAPFWGWLSDRRGRVIVLSIGLAIFLVGSASAALVSDLGLVYVCRFFAGAGAAAIMPTAQAYIADRSNAVDRSRRFVLLGSASFIGLLAGPAFATWLAGPVMREPIGAMSAMLGWPALSVALAGVPILLLIPVCLRTNGIVAAETLARKSGSNRGFVLTSMLIAMSASFSVGTFEVGFNLFGSQTLGFPTTTIAAMFFICSLAMLVAQSSLLFSAVRRRINQRWLAFTLALAALALGFMSLVPNAISLGLLIAVVATGAGMVGPVLSYQLLERHAGARGALLGRQAAAGNLGQALGSMSAGSLFAIAPLAPFWSAAAALLLGAVVSLVWWGRPSIVSRVVQTEAVVDGT